MSTRAERDNRIPGDAEESALSRAPISDAQRVRARRMHLFWRYYKGFHRPALKVAPNQANDNVILNYSRRIVDKGMAFLFGGGVTFEIDSDVSERTPDEQYIDEVWGTPEQKQRGLIDLALNGAVSGTGCVRLYAPVTAGGVPRIVVLDSSMVDVVTNEDDIDDVRAYVITWRAGDTWKRHRIDQQENGMWVVTEEFLSKGNVWQLVQETPWPWQFPPVFMCQNLPDPNSIWGMSDLEEADINDAINFTASNINRILRFHSHPKTIGTGFNASKLQSTSIDQFWSIDEANAKVYNLEMQSDLASAYQYLQTLKETYAKTSGVPNLDPEKLSVGQLSGFAMRILYSDLLDKTDVKRITYGALLADVNAALLEMAGRASGIKVKNVWVDPLPTNVLEEANVLDIDRRNGLSEQTYLERRRYDAIREMKRNQEEQEAQQTIGERMLRQFELGDATGKASVVS
ncbi:MAG: phage portal protein [Hyphomicrobiaceae bacterium]|nr:MAG: phage portal protein [Hyphomicrobiaceae bacterium]